MAGTPVTAERIFDTHAVALGLTKIGATSVADYITKTKADDEAARCIQNAFDAATIANNTDVAHWLHQARHHIKNPVPPDTRR